MWSELKRYARMPRARRRLLWEALAALAIARTIMICLPFRRIAAWLGAAGAQSPETVDSGQTMAAQEIGWAVSAAARRVPWDSRCLAQALAATAMLRRRGMEGTVSFGAKQGKPAAFEAHAWLRVGRCIVTGGPGHEGFKTFTTFARRRP